MQALDWAGIIAACWLASLAVLAPLIGRALKSADQAQAYASPPELDDDTQRMPAVPSVPPARSAHDTDFLADQPFEVRLTETEVRLRCHDILVIEGLSS